MKHVIEHFDIQSRKIGNFEKFFRYAIVGHDREELTEKRSQRCISFLQCHWLSTFKFQRFSTKQGNYFLVMRVLMT